MVKAKGSGQILDRPKFLDRPKVLKQAKGDHTCPLFSIIFSRTFKGVVQ
jgi:hypothetical protein